MDQTRMDRFFRFFYQKQNFPAGGPEYDALLCSVLMEASQAQEASIWQLARDNRLYLKYGSNITPQDASDFSLALGEGITGAVAMARKALKVEDAWSFHNHNRHMDTKIRFRTFSMISAPILCQNQLYGVINLLNHLKKEEFSQHWKELLAAAGIMYGLALKNAGKLVTKPAGLKGKAAGKGDGKTVIIGLSRSIQEVLHLALKAGKSNIPVLIYGETGTGKELAARKIHENSRFRSGPFVSINCAALAETILESELFGHVKGAFSGAVSNRQGKFVSASSGTLFLDEIADMSLSCQAKILRALQEKTITPVGSDKEVKFHAAIIAATNKDLEKLVSQGRFRQDLYFRLCGLEIKMPALRHRVSDIPLLAQYFIRKACEESGNDSRGQLAPRLSDDAITALAGYSWPGNVRQLEQAVMAALAVCENKDIMISDFPSWLVKKEPEATDAVVHKVGTLTSRQNEKIRFLKVLEETRYPGTGRWNIAAAARKLDMPRKTFAYQLKKLNIK